MARRGRGPGPNIGWAVAVVLLVSAAGTIAGALAHSEERRTCNEGSNGCVNYDVRGWPWEWQTDAPDWALKRQRENSDASFFGYGSSGISGGVFVFTTIVWFLGLAMAGVIIGSLVWVIRTLLMLLKQDSPA